MKKRNFALLALLPLVPALSWAGPYSGPIGDGVGVGQPVPGFVGPDGDGIVGDNNGLNPAFQGWATRVIDYSPAAGIDATWSNPDMALGPVYKANPATPFPIPSLEYAVVSLGDLSQQQIDDGVAPGSITLGFDMRIINGEGYDFAVFENALANENNAFLELAYVEVSSDGFNFARFPSVSLNGKEPDLSLGGDPMAYGYRDATNVHNLAGKHQNSGDESWGTGFDLDDLLFVEEVLDGLVNLNNINYIRLVDIPGNGYYLDSLGNPIYDAWETTGSGGFDLAGIGIINGQVPEPAAAALVLLLAALGVTFVRHQRKKSAATLR